MNQTLFTQTIIALIWDFEKTLIPGYMETPIFRRYGVDGAQFWHEVDGLADFYRAQGIEVARDTLYLNHLLTYVQRGILKGLNNALLRELGGELDRPHRRGDRRAHRPRP